MHAFIERDYDVIMMLATDAGDTCEVASDLRLDIIHPKSDTYTNIIDVSAGKKV